MRSANQGGVDEARVRRGRGEEHEEEHGMRLGKLNVEYLWKFRHYDLKCIQEDYHTL